MGLPTSAWANATDYALGQFVTNGGKTYQCVQAGASAANPATGPAGTGAKIVDNGCLWDYVASAAPTGWDVSTAAAAGSNNETAPSAAVAAAGFAANAQPSSTLINYLLMQVDRLLLWLTNMLSYALTWTGAQTFSALATFNGGAVSTASTSAVGDAYGSESGVVVASQHVLAVSGSWAPALAGSSGLPAGATITLAEDFYDTFKVCLAGRDERLMRGVIHVNYAAATAIPVGTGIKIAGAIVPGGAFHAGALSIEATGGTVHSADPITDAGDTGQPFVAFAQINGNGTITVYLLALQNTVALTDFYIPYEVSVVGN